MIKRTAARAARPAAQIVFAMAVLLLVSAAWAGYARGDGRKAPPDKPIPAVMAPLAPYDLLLDVARVGGDHYVAVGARGIIVRSPDGIHWEQVPSPVQSVLTAVDFVDARHGWAVGHAGTILATTDGGKSWTIQNWAPKTEIEFLDVMFFNRNKGFALGSYGLFYKTHNGGKTWTKYESRLTRRGWHLTGIVRLDNGTLVVAGETGLLSKSTDGGKTWQLLDAPWSGSFFGITQLGPNGVLLFGLRAHAFLIEDISAVDPLPPDTDLTYAFKLPPTMKTDSGGADRQDKAAAEARRKQALRQALATSDWQAVQTGQSILSLFGAAATEAGGYVLVGRNGVIWISHDHGADVTRLPNPREGSLAAVVTTPDGDFVIVGREGAFLYQRGTGTDAGE